MTNYLQFNELPNDVKSEIMCVLTSYDEVNVIYEYGEFQVNTSYVLRDGGALDYKFIGVYSVKDVTPNEKDIVNMVKYASNKFLSKRSVKTIMATKKILKEITDMSDFWEKRLGV